MAHVGTSVASRRAFTPDDTFLSDPRPPVFTPSLAHLAGTTHSSRPPCFKASGTPLASPPSTSSYATRRAAMPTASISSPPTCHAANICRSMVGLSTLSWAKASTVGKTTRSKISVVSSLWRSTRTPPRSATPGLRRAYGRTRARRWVPRCARSAHFSLSWRR